MTPNNENRIMDNISIIIPIAPNDESWKNLIDNLPYRDRFAEIILVSQFHLTINHSNTPICHSSVGCNPKNLANTVNITHLASGKNSRASNMNYAASIAKGEFIWFLHADSYIPEPAVNALTKSLNMYPDRLHYFNLQFSDYPIMIINSLGVKFRSDILKCPFGDQAFCIARVIFHRIGGYDESASYGEDHLLVWQARKNGIKLHNVGAAVLTSARKYQQNGWLKTTLNHLWLWTQQVYKVVIAR